MDNRLDPKVKNEWHTALNEYNSTGDGFKHWMYEAKNLADEVGRITYWLGLEHAGKLPKLHQQCSHQEPVPIVDNYLTCCLGVKCKECPHLLALEKAKVIPQELYKIKAWTCASHILHELGARQNQIDTSEGYILTVGDKMYWENVYGSLMGE